MTGPLQNLLILFSSAMPWETLRMLGNKINQLQPTVLPSRSVTVNDGKKNVNIGHIFYLRWHAIGERHNDKF